MCKDIRKSSLYIMNRVKRILLNDPGTHNSCPTEGLKEIKIYAPFSGTVLQCFLSGHCWQTPMLTPFTTQVISFPGYRAVRVSNRALEGYNHYKKYLDNTWMICDTDSIDWNSFYLISIERFKLWSREDK